MTAAAGARCGPTGTACGPPDGAQEIGAYDDDTTGAAGLVRLAADPVALDAPGLDSQARVLLFSPESMAPEEQWPA